MATLMKGHKWRDHKHKMTYPAWGEIKYDEVRVRVHIDPTTDSVWFMSYAEKPLYNLEQFADAFCQLHKDTGYVEFDCGFEVNNSFNDTLRWVRSSKKGIPPELAGKPTRFILFDLPELLGMPFGQRIAIRGNVACCGAAVGLPMQQPDGFWVNSEAEVDTMFQRARERGLEGLMVKSLTHLYELGKRSYGWLKVKPEDDADGEIIAINEAVSLEGELLGRAGSVTVRLEDGTTASPAGIEHALGTDMFNNPDKYIGQWIEFRFMERDRQGGYRHPYFHRFREEKA